MCLRYSYPSLFVPGPHMTGLVVLLQKKVQMFLFTVLTKFSVTAWISGHKSLYLNAYTLRVEPCDQINVIVWLG